VLPDFKVIALFVGTHVLQLAQRTSWLLGPDRCVDRDWFTSNEPATF
jgi:hypothetical protein